MGARPFLLPGAIELLHKAHCVTLSAANGSRCVAFLGTLRKLRMTGWIVQRFPRGVNPFVVLALFD